MISSLTEKQIQLIPIYREKWLNIINSSQDINQNQVIIYLSNLYQLVNYQLPEFRFYPSAYHALLAFTPLEDAYDFFDTEIAVKIEEKITNYLTKKIKEQIESQLITYLWQNLAILSQENIVRLMWDDFKEKEELGDISLLGEYWSMNTETFGDINGIRWASFAAYFDFCFSVLECNDGQKNLDRIELSISGKKREIPSRWQIFQNIAIHCGWFFPLTNLCLVSNKR